MTAGRIQTFEAFWPYYLGEHRHPVNRALHYVGTTLTFVAAGLAVATREPLWLLGMPVGGYFFAWIGHFGVERNRPATFTYPLWSLAGDYRMYFAFLTGRLGRHLSALPPPGSQGTGNNGESQGVVPEGQA